MCNLNFLYQTVPGLLYPNNFFNLKENLRRKKKPNFEGEQKIKEAKSADALIRIQDNKKKGKPKTNIKI